MLKRFEDRIAVVTGATAGIGRAIATELAGAGASLVLNARNPDKLEALATSLAGNSTPVAFVAGDIREPAIIESLTRTALDRFGRIDILINNAGGGSDLQAFEDISDEVWARDLELNLTSAFRSCRSVLPVMKQQGYGRIVNISSVAGRSRGNLSGPPYSAAKAGLQGLTRHLAWEFGPFGITVNALAPGLTETPRMLDKWHGLSNEDQVATLNRVALRRFAQPREIARAALFLSSDDASYVTGATLDANGGIWMV